MQSQLWAELSWAASQIPSITGVNLRDMEAQPPTSGIPSRTLSIVQSKEILAYVKMVSYIEDFYDRGSSNISCHCRCVCKITSQLIMVVVCRKFGSFLYASYMPRTLDQPRNSAIQLPNRTEVGYNNLYFVLLDTAWCWPFLSTNNHSYRKPPIINPDGAIWDPQLWPQPFLIAFPPVISQGS